MEMSRTRACFACILLLMSSSLWATERAQTSTVKFVYPVANGDFVIGLNTDSAYCTNVGTPKYYYVTVGQNGVTSEGSKKMYAAILVALATGDGVAIVFDDATAYCYVNRLNVGN
jgi:hypothetical protein